MKHLKKIAAKLDDHGRNGDSIVAHLNPREAALLKALGGSGSINPKTGLLEFYDGSDPMGSGSDYGSTNDGLGGFGGPESGGGMLPGEPNIDGTPTGPVNPGTYADFSSTPGESYANAIQGGYQPRGMFERAADAVGRWGSNKAHDIRDNPGAFATNIGLGMLLGPAYAIGNEIYGAATGKDVGKGIVGAFAGMNSPSAPNTQTASGSVTGQPTPAIGPSGDTDNKGQEGAYNPTQSGASGSGASPIAQALMGTTPSNQQNGGRMTYGSLNSTYSPFGREYVSPWAYRG